MTKGPLTNVAASVHQRLLNLAKKQSRLQRPAAVLRFGTLALSAFSIGLQRTPDSQGRIAVVCMGGGR